MNELVMIAVIRSFGFPSAVDLRMREPPGDTPSTENVSKRGHKRTISMDSLTAANASRTEKESYTELPELARSIVGGHSEKNIDDVSCRKRTEIVRWFATHLYGAAPPSTLAKEAEATRPPGYRRISNRLKHMAASPFGAEKQFALSRSIPLVVNSRMIAEAKHVHQVSSPDRHDSSLEDFFAVFNTPTLPEFLARLSVINSCEHCNKMDFFTDAALKNIGEQLSRLLKASSRSVNENTDAGVFVDRYELIKTRKSQEDHSWIFDSGDCLLAQLRFRADFALEYLGSTYDIYNHWTSEPDGTATTMETKHIVYAVATKKDHIQYLTACQYAIYLKTLPQHIQKQQICTWYWASELTTEVERQAKIELINRYEAAALSSSNTEHTKDISDEIPSHVQVDSIVDDEMLASSPEKIRKIVPNSDPAKEQHDVKRALVTDTSDSSERDRTMFGVQSLETEVSVEQHNSNITASGDQEETSLDNRDLFADDNSVVNRDNLVINDINQDSSNFSIVGANLGLISNLPPDNPRAAQTVDSAPVVAASRFPNSLELDHLYVIAACQPDPVDCAYRFLCYRVYEHEMLLPLEERTKEKRNFVDGIILRKYAKISTTVDVVRKMLKIDEELMAKKINA